MRTNYALLTTALVLGAAVLICGCTGLPGGDARNQTTSASAGVPVGENLTIDEVLVRDGNFSTFVQAIDAAGLEKTFTGPGPYTVFAPTDEAFSRLPDAVMEELFDDPKGNLAEVLLYHVAPGNCMASGIAANGTIATVQGSPIAVDATGGNVMVNDAEVIRADIPAANGVICAIDAVMLPPGMTETAVNVTTNMTG
ncbi:MAG: fasciclin domain-containing protein [Methanoculleus sp.]|nr:fasciclin domain-containing protein [Methanoculleus sp.]